MHGMINHTYTSTTAAAALGCSTSTIRRHCASHGIGTRIGRDWLISGSDLDRLRSVVRPGPGNPNAVPGNHFFGGVNPHGSTSCVKPQKKRK